MTLIALVDCNNFFVSCERVFNPSLKDKPVVVLSNNDGCAISRSNQAKQIGIKMGQPYFQFKSLALSHKVVVLSSNFGLYAEMSKRVMQVISDFSPIVEYYSVDEAFLEIPHYVKNPYDYSVNLRQTILRWTGIPVSIGIARTKTLAKLANEHIKSNNPEVGVYDLSDFSDTQLTQFLDTIPVQDIWGIGRRHAATLHLLQVKTALDYKNLDSSFVRKKFTVTGLRTHQELHNIACLPLITMPEQQKQLIVTRSFGNPTSQKQDLLQALTSHASKAAEKLRQKNLKASNLVIYITDKKTFSRTKSISFEKPTNFTADFLKPIQSTLNSIYAPNITYKKAGVFCFNLSSDKRTQLDFFSNKVESKNKKLISQTLDKINAKYGHNTLTYLVTGLKSKQQPWLMKQTLKSPNYLSDWNQLAKVK